MKMLVSVKVDDGGIEYFNTIVVQPHLKLVTNQGKGFHIRCRYTTRNNTAYNEALKMDPRTSPEDHVTAMAAMPGCSMKIYTGEPSDHIVAENVKIGDPLSLVVSIDSQDLYGIQVADCVVKDGLGWGEQKLIDSEGCPTDQEIMGMFKYSEDNNRAEVHFKAHKFPYIASVYYQCNVKLCLKANNGCETKTFVNYNGACFVLSLGIDLHLKGLSTMPKVQTCKQIKRINRKIVDKNIKSWDFWES
ncbi:hypothetical protein HUJ04_004865 [Dendroctonus ponderosae]|nr:hypothetical protein HUJ04_004865 [Dendroctonus ponderosae]